MILNAFVAVKRKTHTLKDITSHAHMLQVVKHMSLFVECAMIQLTVIA